MRSSSAFSAVKAVSKVLDCEQTPENIRTCAVLSQDALSPLDKTLFIPHHAADFDYVAGNSILENLDCLRRGNRTSKKLNQVSGIENRCGIVCLSEAGENVSKMFGDAKQSTQEYLSGRLHCHGTLHEI